MIYSFPYLIFLTILLALLFIETGRIRICKRNTSQVLAYIIAFVFIGLRGHVMCDFINYYPYFESFPDFATLCTRYKFLYYGFEPAFCIYTGIVKFICNNYFFWVALGVGIDLIVLFVTFRRYCTSVILPLICFFIFQGYTIEFNLLRSSKALDLFLLSLPYLQNRQFLKYFSLNVLGAFFHSSALLYIPFYFLLTRNIRNSIIWMGIGISNLFFLLNIPVINTILNNINFIQVIGVYDKLLGYVDRGVEVGISFGYIERTISMLLFIGYKDKLIKAHAFNRIFFNSFWIYYVTFLLFHEVTVFVERIPLLFVFAYWVLYPNMVAIKSRYRQLITSIVCLLITSRAITGFGHKTMTYTNIIITTPDYEASKRMQLEEMNI